MAVAHDVLQDVADEVALDALEGQGVLDDVDDLPAPLRVVARVVDRVGDRLSFLCRDLVADPRKLDREPVGLPVVLLGDLQVVLRLKVPCLGLLAELLRQRVLRLKLALKVGVHGVDPVAQLDDRRLRHAALPEARVLVGHLPGRSQDVLADGMGDGWPSGPCCRIRRHRARLPRSSRTSRRLGRARGRRPSARRRRPRGRCTSRASR